MHKNQKIAIVASVLVVVAALIALYVFYPPDEVPAQYHVAQEVSPETGNILIDISDTATEEDFNRIRTLIIEAVEPLTTSFPLGVELSDPANLFLTTPPRSEADDVIRLLRNDPAVEAVEMERTCSIPANETSAVVHTSDEAGDGFPNDPLYKYQWNMDMIQMPETWNEQDGTGAVVAVIDTGVAYGGRRPMAPDLAQTHFVPGYDFIDNDEYPDDGHGHGTHCAGSVAQSTNNGVGVTGVAPGASIMPIRVLDNNGSGGWGGVAAGIRWAADHGANIISMSLGSSSSSSAIQKAIDYAHDHGVIVIAAAGNSNLDHVDYPGGNNHVVAVGSVNSGMTRAFYSSYGTGLDIVAPGGDSRTDANGDGMVDGVLQNTLVDSNPNSFDYFAWQGTSMATPHVAGLAALIYAEGVTNPDDIERVLYDSARDLGDEWQYGGGLIQAHDAVVLAQSRADTHANHTRAHTSGVVSVLQSLGSLLLFSIFPFFLLTALTYHMEALRPFLGLACVVGSANMMVESFTQWVSFSDVALIPNVLMIPWLIVNAILTGALAFLIFKR